MDSSSSCSPGILSAATAPPLPPAAFDAPRMSLSSSSSSSSSVEGSSSCIGNVGQSPAIGGGERSLVFSSGCSSETNWIAVRFLSLAARGCPEPCGSIATADLRRGLRDGFLEEVTRARSLPPPGFSSTRTDGAGSGMGSALAKDKGVLSFMTSLDHLLLLLLSEMASGVLTGGVSVLDGSAVWMGITAGVACSTKQGSSSSSSSSPLSSDSELGSSRELGGTVWAVGGRHSTDSSRETSSVSGCWLDSVRKNLTLWPRW
mmetsp:Transcript_42495/g.98492  ORF Transcript_42495/g.98492 Transcript_42495/m.98492 type:complete len:260 (+) Transcript_42495:301-1080(+)